MKDKPKKEFICSFCDKTDKQVKYMIARKDNDLICICNKCVEHARDIIGFKRFKQELLK